MIGDPPSEPDVKAKVIRRSPPVADVSVGEAGTKAVIAEVGLDNAAVDPAPFVAVTETRKYFPESAPTRVYVFVLALEISEKEPLEVAARCH